MDIQNEIIKTIELIVQKAVENQQNLDVSSVVVGINGNKAQVIVDGNIYEVNNTLGLKKGDNVWLHIPNSRNNMNQMFMMARKSGTISGGSSDSGGGTTVDLSNYYSTSDIATKNDIDNIVD